MLANLDIPATQHIYQAKGKAPEVHPGDCTGTKGVNHPPCGVSSVIVANVFSFSNTFRNMAPN